MFDSHRMRAGFLTAMLTGAALSASASAAAQEAHGIIVYGETEQANGVAYGFAWNFPAKDTAHAEAVNACIASGGTNCMELAWFRNGCGALAIDQYGNAQGKPGMTREQAEARALQMCEAAGGVGCNIVGSLCATPDGDPGTYSGSESVLPAHGVQAAVTEKADESLTREERVLVQQTLNALGLDAGPPDGVFGERTRSAIREWQQAKGLEATGWLTREEAKALATGAGEDRGDQTSREASGAARSGNQVLYLAAAGPKCADMPEGSACWKEIANHPDCFVFDTYLRHDQTVNWSGSCSGDTAHGHGTASWRNSGGSVEVTGDYVHGKMNGTWVEHWSDGVTSEGPFVDGQKHGNWVIRRPDGTTEEGPFVDGLRDGNWIFRFPDGHTEEGSFAFGQRLGNWVLRFPDGHTEEGPFVDGQRLGNWVLRFPDGHTEEGPFVDGQRHGDWVLRQPDGHTAEGPFVDGQQHGYWIFCFPDGDCVESYWENGEFVR